MVLGLMTCPKCEGEGEVGEVCDPDFHQTGIRCRYCNGRGYHMVTCPQCDGDCEVPEEEESANAA